MAQVIWHKAYNRHEHSQDQPQGKQILQHEIWPEWQRVLFSLSFGATAHFNTRRVVVACGVERPDV